MNYLYNIRKVVCALSLFSLVGALHAEGELTLDSLLNAYTRKNVNRVSVHDPSLFIDSISSTSNDYYYMLGSHLAMGRYVIQRSSGVMGAMSAVSTVGEWNNSFFGNQSGTAIACTEAYNTPAVKRVKNYAGEEVDFPAFNAHSWQAKGNNVRGMQWAPDVVYNPTMQKWLCYMSLNGDNWCSSIVCFAANKPTGPFIYQGLVVCSGFSGHYEHNGYVAADDWKKTDFTIATGETSLPARYQPYSTSDGYYYGKFWPNCIDPCVFYDEAGKLWMSYGSWSSGIWMIELDEETGLRDYTVRYPYQVNGTTVTPGGANANCTSDPYFGKKIAGGWYDSGEGSYIEHIGDWYYLFVSYGGFAPDGGYEMRLYRSAQPDGPYVDATGGSAIQLNKYQMNYGPSATFHNGVKLMGGYQWGFMSSAELSQGHNSALTDRNGRSLVCYHTKFNDGTAGHSVRLHQLFQNQDGWLVAAPFEFHNEKVTQAEVASAENIPNAEIPGNCLLLSHNYKVKYDTMGYQKPVNVTLVANEGDPYSGSITGGKVGTWRREPGTDFVTFTIGSLAYRGVLCRQTVDYSNAPALCFTVVSTSGGGTLGTNAQLSLWGAKVDYKAAIKCALDELTVPVSDGMHVTEKLTLPVTSTYKPTRLGALVSWSSSNEQVLTSKGVVKGDGEVTLTLTISKDGHSYNKSYRLLVGDLSGIADIYNDCARGSELFDLYGRRVQQPHGKMYIIKGRKVSVCR